MAEWADASQAIIPMACKAVGLAIGELMIKVPALVEERRLKRIAEREEAEAERVAREQRRIQLEIEEAARKEAARQPS